MLSGQEVARFPVEGLRNARDVKQQLSQLDALPPRFRQRLFHLGASLDDADKVDSAADLDLDLVVLNFCSASQAQLDELVAAAREGSVEKAGACIITAVSAPVEVDSGQKTK